MKAVSFFRVYEMALKEAGAIGVNIFAQNIVFGAVLIAAVAIPIDRSKIPVVK